jgi:hypothetical protein
MHPQHCKKVAARGEGSIGKFRNVPRLATVFGLTRAHENLCCGVAVRFGGFATTERGVER